MIKKFINLGYNWELLGLITNVIFGILAYIWGRLNWDITIINISWILSYLGGGWFGAKASWEALKARSINVDVLMLLAALGAAIIGKPAEGAILLFLFSLSNTLQSFALQKSRNAISSLMELRPEYIMIKSNNTWQKQQLEKVKIGDICLIRPGVIIAVDGIVVSGVSEVNQASISGESMMVEKLIDDKIYSGSKNGNGILEIKVTATSEQSTLSKIVSVVEIAQANKAKTQSWLDRVESYYAIFVISIFILLIFIPYLLKIEYFDENFYKAVTWLVVASPCALIISTPASILSALAKAARNGVLFKGGVSLEQAAKIDLIAIDKTGTLTTGKPSLQTIYSPIIPEKEFLSIAASLELNSEHIIAQTIVEYAKGKDIKIEKANKDFKALPGQGIIGKIKDQKYIIGNIRLMNKYKIVIKKEIKKEIEKSLKNAETIVYLANKTTGKFIGIIGLRDTIREQAYSLVKELKKIAINKVVMLTGDNKNSAEFTAKKLKIKDYYDSLLPKDKLTKIKGLAKENSVAMIGDGINDAPALATATVGISMGSGATDVAIDTADIVLMSNNLLKIPYLIKLAKKSQRIIWQNLFFSTLVIIMLVAVNFFGELPLTIGVLFHEGSTLVVILNGLRMFLYKT